MFRQRPYGAFSEAFSFKQEEITMVTMHLSDDFTAKEQDILAKTFHANCQHLGIADADFSVSVQRKVIGPKRRQGAMKQVTPNTFLVLLNKEGFNLFEGISVLGHEAVHIRQYLNGDLSDHSEGCCWRGTIFPKFICEATETYQHLPWEREAFELQPKLHTRYL